MITGKIISALSESMNAWTSLLTQGDFAEFGEQRTIRYLESANALLITSDRFPPEGCDCIEDTIINYRGLRILGLGGCQLYNGGPHQYTERQMARRIRKLYWKIRRAGGIDIVLTHAPAAGYGDAEDTAHRGFQCFTQLIDKYHPKYFIHSHVHLNYGHNIPRELERNGTKIINAYERFELEI